MVSFVKGSRFALGVSAVLLLAGTAYFSIPSVRARAQAGGDGPGIIKSAGPVMLNRNESALIGLLFPVANELAEPFRLRLFDSSGRTLVSIPVAALGDGSVRTAFFNVYFADGSVRITDRATGKLLYSGKSDGVFEAMLLPAVQRSGQQVKPITASVQILSPGGQREQVIGMCDGSV